MKMGPPDANVLAQTEPMFHREAAVLDQHLARHEWLVGETMTLADFIVVAPLFHAEPAKLPLAEYANIKGWFARLAALPAWRETAPKLPAAA
jgi:glutathione S-transferase